MAFSGSTRGWGDYGTPGSLSDGPSYLVVARHVSERVAALFGFEAGSVLRISSSSDLEWAGT